MIILICGYPGVGKTTLANELGPLINAVILSTDKIRKELIDKPTYNEQEKKLIYDVLILIAKYLHNAGKNCILDATFNSQESRDDIKKKLM
ncbi:MAG TPA: AAA family ATPase, partial [Nitrososphaeraceae archaeon]|nr:AAA family ATPase [Nitrososphaeraceae archaeon]